MFVFYFLKSEYKYKGEKKSSFLLHTSSALLGRPAGPDPSCREKLPFQKLKLYALSGLLFEKN